VSQAQHKAELKMVEEAMKLIHDIDISMMQAQLHETNDRYKLAAALLEHAHFSKPADAHPLTAPGYPPTQSAEQLPSASSDPAKEDWSQSETGWTHQEEWRQEEWHQDTRSKEQWHQEEWLQDEWKDEDWRQEDWHESSKPSTQNTENEDTAAGPPQKKEREAWRIRGGPIVMFKYALV
jgi:hypothetical protein